MNYPANCKYTLLISSLPVHKHDMFADDHVPLSRIKLNKQLSLLDFRDAADLEKIEQLLHWSQIKIDIDQSFVEKTIQSINSIDNTFIQHIIIWRLELRIILAALRMRHQGQSQPPKKNIFGFDYWYFIMNKYWHQPDLGLSKQIPWITLANELLINNKSLELEKLLFSVVWEHYRRQSFGHYFNFEAVIIYVLRWDIISRWTSNHGETALKRFDDLINKELQQLDV